MSTGPVSRAIAMLSTFNAQPIVELKQRDKSRIESVLAYGICRDCECLRNLANHFMVR